MLGAYSLLLALGFLLRDFLFTTVLEPLDDALGAAFLERMGVSREILAGVLDVVPRQPLDSLQQVFEHQAGRSHVSGAADQLIAVEHRAAHVAFLAEAKV